MTLASGLRSVSQLGLALSPWVPVAGPTRSAQITAAWLTENLGAPVPGAVALSATDIGGTTGTTDRRRVAVVWNQAGIDAGLPAAVFVKSTPLNAKNRTMVASLDMSVNEVRFYSEIRDELGEIAPKAWFAYAGPGARHLIVLDDLAARGCTTYVIADSCEVDHVRAVIDSLATMHATYWESPRFATDLSWARKWSDRPGYLVLKAFYRKGRRKALTMPEWDFDTPAVRRVVDFLDQNDSALWRKIDEFPATLLHGDPHLGNTYSLPDGSGALLDWQVVWQGPGLRDLSYFLVSALEPEQRRAHERELVNRYVDALRAHGVTGLPDEDTAFDLYKLFIAEAFDGAALTVAWPGLAAVEGVEACIRRIQAAVEDLDLVDALERVLDL